MAQFPRPDSTISNTGFSSSTGGALWTTIDESTPSDVDYNTAASANQSFEVGLSDVSDPVSSTGHTFRFRAAYISGTTRSVTAVLKQGTTTIATYSPTITSSFAEYTYTLTAGEADSITDYADLRWNFNTGASAFAIESEVQVSWMEFEVPNAPAPPATDNNNQVIIITTQSI